MKIIRKNQTERFQNGENCIAFEYPSEDRDINGAVIELGGRYPGKGRVVNSECKELIYVVSGSGLVVIEGKEFNIDEGDLVSIEPGEKYFWDGKMKIFIASTPAWHPGQYREVE